jgi:hypothetical protein
MVHRFTSPIEIVVFSLEATARPALPVAPARHRGIRPNFGSMHEPGMVQSSPTLLPRRCSRAAPGLRMWDELALVMPDVTVKHGSRGNFIYQVRGASFVFFHVPRPDTFDPETRECYAT